MKNRVAKMQFLTLVGNAFLHLIRCNPFAKMHQCTSSFPCILPNRFLYYSVGYPVSHFAFALLEFEFSYQVIKIMFPHISSTESSLIKGLTSSFIFSKEEVLNFSFSNSKTASDNCRVSYR